MNRTFKLTRDQQLRITAGKNDVYPEPDLDPTGDPLMMKDSSIT